MIKSAPHFLLFSEGGCEREHSNTLAERAAATWRFVLESVDGNSRLEAVDAEDRTDNNRLALLAVVRGLEALDQPSRVTLVTSSRYVNRGFRFGLDQWRESEWQWERFGEMSPIKNHDLWQRVDVALQYHDVECRMWQFDGYRDMVDQPCVVESSPSQPLSQAEPSNNKHNQTKDPDSRIWQAAFSAMRRGCSGMLRSLTWNGWEAQSA